MALWIASIALAVLGLAAAAVGWRGRRVNDHPICRGCGFDVVGLVEPAGGSGGSGGEQASGRCPECGRDLGRRRAVREGARRRRRAVLAAGVAVFLIGAVWTGALVWGRAQGFDWNSVKPTWLLVMETRQPTGENADAGMQELVKRLEAGKLAAETVDAIVERVLEAQGDLQAQWHESWGEFVEAAHRADRLAPAQLERYLTQAVGEGLTAHELTYRNGSLKYGIRMKSSRGASSAGLPRFNIRVYAHSMEIGAETIDPKLVAFFGVGQRAGATTAMQNDVTLPPGELDVKMHARVDVVEGFSSTTEGIVSWPLILPATVTVDPSAPVVYVDDPALAPVYHDGHPQTPEVRAVEGGARIDGFMHFESVPVGMVARVFFLADGREWEVGRLNLRAGGSMGINIMSTEALPEFTARRVDIILRTIEDEQPDASWPGEVWRGELVIPDVPLRWVGEGGS